MKPIPISAAKAIAEKYDYDQVIVIARKVGQGEHCTTYGVNKENCDVAARCGDFLKFKVMGWHQEGKSRNKSCYRLSKKSVRLMKTRCAAIKPETNAH